MKFSSNYLESSFITIVTASRAAKARMSAQETMPGHATSKAAFAASMTWKPLRLWLGIASFSAGIPFVEFSSTEPSHP